MAVASRDASAIEEEVGAIRGLFFNFFVEAVVKTVLGEDEVWLVETTQQGPRLFVWARRSETLT